VWASSAQVADNFIDFQPGTSLTAENFLDPNDYHSIKDIISMYQNPEFPDVKAFTLASLVDVDLRSGIYMACASCHKKVEVTCFNPRCMQAEQSSGVVPRYKISIDIIDHTAFFQKLMLFGDAAEMFLGLPAAEFNDFGHERKEKMRSSILWHKYKVCLKMNSASKRLLVVSCQPVDFGEALIIAESRIVY